jgi:hypothetical protein
MSVVSEVKAKLAARRAAAGATTPPATARECGGLQEAAAVLMSFRIESLKPAPGAPAADTPETVLALSLPSASTASPERLWSMRSEPRIAALRQLRETGRLQVALDANPERSKDPVQAAFEAYLTGTAKPVEEQSEKSFTQALVDLTAFQQIADWITAAGFPGAQDLAMVRRQSEWLKLLQPFEHLAGDFFRGRVDELASLRSYVGVLLPQSLRESLHRGVRGVRSLFGPPDRPLLIYGPGGVGKSSLVSRFILEHARAVEEDRFPFAYLDFDRPEVSSSQPLTLLIEAIRQFGIEYVESQERCERVRLGWFQLFRTDVMNKQGAPAPTRIPASALASAVVEFASLASSIGAADRPVVMVVDTFEEVQYRSAEETADVWNLFDELRSQISRLRVIVVGRAPMTGRTLEVMELEEFDNDSAIGYLEARGVNAQLAAQIYKLVGGSPMNLQMAAELALRDGIQTASDLGVTSRDYFFLRLNTGRMQRQLYRRVLEHIHDDRVRRVAAPGLILRRITPDLIFQVLNDPCCLNLTSLAQAEELFKELKREVSLVREDKDGALVHRGELRQIILPLLVENGRPQAAAIHQGAVSYYENRPLAVNERAEEVYHRLALGQDLDIVSSRWAPGVEPFLEEVYHEFSGANRAYLAARLNKEIDEQTRNLASLEDWENVTARKAADLLASGQNAQALQMIRARTERTPESALYALEATALTRLGNRREAFEVLDRGIQEAVNAGARQQVLGLLLQAADLVIASRREFVPEWLVSRMQSIPVAFLSVEDRVMILARQITLANMDVPFRANPAADIDANLRKAFDELSDRDLARRPEVAWWAATAFQTGDLARLARVIQHAGVPRTEAERELRDLGSQIAFFDVAVSNAAGQPPGALARKGQIPIASTLTETWGSFLLGAPSHRVQEALGRVLDETAVPVSWEMIQAMEQLMRAGVGVPVVAPMTRTQTQTGTAGVVRQHRLSGEQRSLLHASLTECFPNAERFAEFLRLRLDWGLDSISPRDTMALMIFRVIQWADLRGATADLVNAARLTNPQHPGLIGLAREMGISTVAAATLEVQRAGIIDLNEWSGRLGVIEGQVCRVEIRGSIATGFLVGPDLIMTASHITDWNTVRPADIVFRFDYRTLGGRILFEGTVFGAAREWLVNWSSPADLDYALLRASSSPGTQPIGGSKAESYAAFRRWIVMDAPAPARPREGDLMCAAYYSGGGPLQLAVGHVSLAETLRVNFDAAAGPGASGAPCFDSNFQVAAMLIGGVKAEHPPETLFGIRTTAILEDLEQKGLGCLVNISLA